MKRQRKENKRHDKKTIENSDIMKWRKHIQKHQKQKKRQEMTTR